MQLHYDRIQTFLAAVKTNNLQTQHLKNHASKRPPVTLIDRLLSLNDTAFLHLKSPRVQLVDYWMFLALGGACADAIVHCWRCFALIKCIFDLFALQDGK